MIFGQRPSHIKTYGDYLNYCKSSMVDMNDLDPAIQRLVRGYIGRRVIADAKLHDYKTGEVIRDATPAELAESIEAEKHDGGAGVIVVDGRNCYVR